VNGFPSDSERAYSIAYHAGVYGLTAEDCARLVVDLYSRPGKKALHRAKLEKTLRAWAKGREAAAQHAHDDAEPSRCPTPEPREATAATPELTSTPELTVPEAGMIGVARDFADLYGQYLESPRSFFYFNLLAYFGAIVARQITLDSVLAPEPRLYTVKVGPSSDSRKSTLLRITEQFFRSLGEEWAPDSLMSLESAEGLAKELNEHPQLVLHFDELKSFVDKAKAESSVLFPMVSTLFERGDYDNRTREGNLAVRNVSLSLVAACTADTYATMFDARFFNIGFLNRLWIVADRTTKQIPVPKPVPVPSVERLQQRTVDLLPILKRAWQANLYRPVPLRLTADAEAMCAEWYHAREGSIVEKRLDSYGHRLMVLLAATAGASKIDATVMTAVLALLRYQLNARRECDPVNAENQIAGLEERIRRTFRRGPVSRRDLQRRCHYERVGLWMWKTALDNLTRAREVWHDKKRDLYGLSVEAGCQQVAPIAVPSTKGDLTSRKQRLSPYLRGGGGYTLRG